MYFPWFFSLFLSKKPLLDSGARLLPSTSTSGIGGRTISCAPQEPIFGQQQIQVCPKMVINETGCDGIKM